MTAHAGDTANSVQTRGLCELTLESADHRRLADFYRRVVDLPLLSEQDGHDFRGHVEHEGGDHSLYFEDPQGNVVELWDFVQDANGVAAGIDAL